jgi:hypothetical protein
LNDEIEDWPSTAQLRSALTARVEQALGDSGHRLAEIGTAIMSAEDRLLSADPRPQSSLLVIAACVSAGGTWQQARLGLTGTPRHAVAATLALTPATGRFFVPGTSVFWSF